MLIECPECKNPVSDKAPACPKCGIAVQPGGKKIPVGSRRKATQWVWFFFWLFIIGIFWPLFSEGENAPVPYLVITGMVGWVGALVYRWTNT